MQFTQDALFSISEIETDGYAQPQPAVDIETPEDETANEPQAEAA